MYGRRVPKNHPRAAANGSIDELTAALGLARASSHDKFVSEQILAVQKDLITMMGELATLPEDLDRYRKDGFKETTGAMVDRVGQLIAELEKDKSLYPKDWVIPGGNPLSAALDFARTMARQAERAVVSVANLNPEILRYLNRLSDLCWILARYVEKHHSPSP